MVFTHLYNVANFQDPGSQTSFTTHMALMLNEGLGILGPTKNQKAVGKPGVQCDVMVY